MSSHSCGSGRCTHTFANSTALSQHQDHHLHYQEQFRRHQQVLRGTASAVLHESIQEPPAKHLKTSSCNSSELVVQVSFFFPGLHLKFMGLPMNSLEHPQCTMQPHPFLSRHLLVLGFHCHQKVQSYQIVSLHHNQISLLVIRNPSPLSNPTPLHGTCLNHERDACLLDIETTFQSHLPPLTQFPLPPFYPKLFSMSSTQFTPVSIDLV